MTMVGHKSISQPRDNWAAGEAYEPYVGRWSRLVADEFLQWLAVPTRGLWLDVGCGTGVLVRAILEAAAPRAVKGIDAAQSYIAFARQQISDSRASFQLGDAQSLPVETASYDVVVSGLVLNFVPDPDRAIAEMARLANPGGLIAAYVWDYAGGM
jgi:ubiquinone/menaquinone biosynthesis C-methylase UbiE